MLEQLNLAIVDLETTGATAAYDRIIEIGVKRVEAGQVVRSYATLVNPGRRIPPFIQQMTGITDAQVADAPTFDQVADQVRQLLDGCIFVAHNARFDYGFLKHEFRRLNHAFSADCLCTVRLSRLLYPRCRKHSLSSLIQRFQFSYVNRHRALDDADVVWQFLDHARHTVEAERLAKAVTRLLARPTLPPQLPPEAIDALPTGPGVYVFFDANGMPLYVGKSVEIRDRVLAHFSSDHESGKAMRIAQQTARIETYPAFGELGALLLESRWIKQLSPLYNRRSRIARNLTVIRRGEPRRGYETASLGTLADGPDQQEALLAVFHSKPRARAFLHELARAHRLCPTLLGLERDDGPCIYTQMKACAGACEGREAPVAYNARFAEAFAGRRIKPWPYPGPVLVQEVNLDRTRGHLFVIEGWQIVRALSDSEDGVASLWTPSPWFDYDQYQILLRYLAQHGHRAAPLSRAEALRLGVQADGDQADGDEWERADINRWGNHAEVHDGDQSG